MEPITAPRPLFYTIKTLAAELGLEPRKVKRMVESGYLPSRRLGRRVILRPEEIEAALGTLPVREVVKAEEPAATGISPEFSDN